MNKRIDKKIIPLLIIVPIIGIIFFVLINYIGAAYHRGQQMKNLEFIFCQQLHRGMTLEEVREVLSQYGEYSEYRHEFSGYFQIMIIFKSNLVKEKIGYGRIYLNFDNNIGYVGPEYQEDIDNKGICKNGLSE